MKHFFGLVNMFIALFLSSEFNVVVVIVVFVVVVVVVIVVVVVVVVWRPSGQNPKKIKVKISSEAIGKVFSYM